MNEKRFSAILAAGGSGTRFGGHINKVYLPLDGQTVIGVSLDKFLHHPLVAEVIVVYRKEDEAILMPILAEKGAGSEVPLLAVPGGASRRDSVRKGLSGIRPALQTLQRPWRKSPGRQLRSLPRIRSRSPMSGGGSF